MRVIVDAVPDAAGAGDLVLPLIEFPAANNMLCQPASERVLSAWVRSIAWILRHCFPRIERGARRLPRQLFPSRHCVRVGIAHVPAAATWRRSDAVLSFGHFSGGP